MSRFRQQNSRKKKSRLDIRYNMMGLGNKEIEQKSGRIRERYVRIWASLVAQRFKRLSGMLETWVQTLSWEDPLEQEMLKYGAFAR